MTDEPKQAQEPVYVVRLNAEERQEMMDACYSGYKNQPRWLPHVLSEARPEHPDRQAALEELAKACNEHYHGHASSTNTAELVAKATNNLRSLEAK